MIDEMVCQMQSITHYHATWDAVNPWDAVKDQKLTEPNICEIKYFVVPIS